MLVLSSLSVLDSSPWMTLPTADNLSQTHPDICFHGVSICFSFLFVYELEERSVPQRTEEVPGLLVLELQTAMNLPTLVLETELGSSGRAVTTEESL